MRKLALWRKSHKIELFASAVLLVAVLLVADFIAIMAHSKSLDRDTLTSEAIYASNFTTSLSGVKGEITNVYVNDDLTKCGVLVKFEDMSNIVTDALTYQVYVKGFNVSRGDYAQTTLCSPKGGYYVFGPTGYALIYLVDSNGFQSQALELIVRCNDTIFKSSQSSQDVAALKERDGSYEQFDQYRIIINPAAEKAERVSFLDDFDVVSLYRDAVADASEMAIRETLTADVAELNTQMKAIQNYRAQLEALNVKVPALPDYVAHDRFENDEDGMLIYTSGVTMSGGVDFDWYHTDLHTGSFLTEDIIGLKKPTQFFGDLRAMEHDSFVVPKEFYTIEGELIAEDTESPMSDIAAMSKGIANYRSALQNYFNAKYEYQTEDLLNYLYLEYNMYNTGKNFTSNYSDNAVIVW